MTDMLVMILLVSGLVVRTTDAQNCLGFSYSRHQNQRLVYGIFKTQECSPIECQKDCARTASCFSVNTYRNTEGTMTCELLKETIESEGWSALQHKNGGEHNELESFTSFDEKSTKCKITKKGILPGHWYVHDSTAFKLFKEFKTHSEAKSVCEANGGELAIINNENENKFVSELLLTKITKDPTPEICRVNPLKHWKLDGTDPDVVLHGKAVFKKGIDDNVASLYLPGITGSYATTPAVDFTNTSISIAFWLKLDSIPSGDYFIYSYWGSPYIFSFYVYNAGNKVKFRAEGRTRGAKEDDVQAFDCQGGSVVPNVWTHAAITLNKGSRRVIFYRDGVMQSMGQYNSPLPSPVRNVFDIGLKRDTNQVTRGWIRDLMVFNRVLTVDATNRIIAATSLKFNVWIGAPKNYLNIASDPQPNTNCMSMRGWGNNQWDKARSHWMMEFICSKAV